MTTSQISGTDAGADADELARDKYGARMVDPRAVKPTEEISR
jgi:hypothetical protein